MKQSATFRWARLAALLLAADIALAAPVATLDPGGSSPVTDAKNNPTTSVRNGPQPAQPNPGKSPADPHSPDPINTINGNISWEETDLVLPCPSLDLVWARYYNSCSGDPNANLGYGWNHSFGTSLTLSNNTFHGYLFGSFMVLHMGNGQTCWFPLGNVDGLPQPPEDSQLRLQNVIVQEPNQEFGYYRVTAPGGNTADFDIQGHLIRMADGFGTGITLTYGFLPNVLVRAQHDNGRTLDFSYDAGVQLTRVDVGHRCRIWKTAR